MPANSNPTRNEIRDAIRQAMREAYLHGEGWVYARLLTDGTVISGREVSKAVPKSEYFGRKPHPVTFFDRQASPGDRYTAWADVPEGGDLEEEIDATLSEADFDEETDEAVRMLEETGYTVTD